MWLRRLKVPVRVVSVQCERKHCFEEEKYVLREQLGLRRKSEVGIGQVEF